MKRIGIIILAAGGAKRFGSAKLLLKLPGGRTLVRHIAEIACSAGLTPVVCVVGERAVDIRSEVAGLPITIVLNDRWESGISSSVKAGIKALPHDVAACLVLLGDQPFVSAKLIRKIAAYYQDYDAEIIVPVVMGERSNPVLLDRAVFDAIETLTGDTGAKALFSQFKLKELKWEDDRLPLDIDTPEDFKNIQYRISSNS